MNPIRDSILAFALLMLASQVKGIRVDAADRNLDGLITLYAGNHYLVIDGDSEAESGLISDIGMPPIDMTAKAETYDSSHSYTFGPNFYYEYYRGKITHHDYTDSEKEFFGNNGPDAVADCNGHMFYFKGCRVAQDGHFGAAENVQTYGLPCSPDAAWKSEDGRGMTVLKGDQISTWDCQGKVSEVKPFFYDYSISWTLSP